MSRRFRLRLWLDRHLWPFRNPRWWARQKLAQPARYYGGTGTVHGTTSLDVETHGGKVVAVWFRCSMLPFRQVEVDEVRAHEMLAACSFPRITGVELLDAPHPEDPQ